MQKYRDWDILEKLPDGWVIDKTAGSPAPNTVFITNGKSPLKGQKRALLKVKSKQDITIQKEEPLVNVQKMHIANPKKEEPYVFPSKSHAARYFKYSTPAAIQHFLKYNISTTNGKLKNAIIEFTTESVTTIERNPITVNGV